MPQVVMTIAGRPYRVACDEGEEDHLLELARTVDGRIAGMREKFGAMGDQRLTVMAAVTLADELFESTRRVGELEAENAAIRREAESARGGEAQWIDRVAASIGEAADRIEQFAHDLNAPRGDPHGEARSGPGGGV
jgi:cell division protein ZapA